MSLVRVDLELVRARLHVHERRRTAADLARRHRLVATNAARMRLVAASLPRQRPSLDDGGPDKQKTPGLAHPEVFTNQATSEESPGGCCLHGRA